MESQKQPQINANPILINFLRVLTMLTKALERKARQTYHARSQYPDIYLSFRKKFLDIFKKKAGHGQKVVKQYLGTLFIPETLGGTRENPVCRAPYIYSFWTGISSSSLDKFSVLQFDVGCNSFGAGWKIQPLSDQSHVAWRKMRQYIISFSLSCKIFHR
jgi:hypothetical protein